MPRKARVEFAGAVYHLLDRGDRREAVFRDDRDRETFLRTLSQACERTGWRVHAWVLMTNHYQVLMEAMTCFGMNEIDLMQLKRSDSRKLAIARLIRNRTSVPNQWIVRELSLGHVSNVSRYCPRTAAKGAEDEKLNDWFKSKDDS